MEKQSSSAKMGTMPIKKLIFSMSLPAMLSMFVQSMYNVIDSIFVAQISQDALTAVSLAFPIQMLISAFSLGIGVGINTNIARQLGAKNQDKAQGIANTGMLLTVLNAIIFLVFGFLFAKPFISLYTDVPIIAEYGGTYLSIVCIFSISIFVEIVCSRILQATGNMVIPMISQLIGAITNIILDPILIFGWLGMPVMGVSGAALATVIGQFFSMCFSLYIFKTRSHEVSLHMRNLSLKKEYVIDIYRIGIPAIVTNAIASVCTTCMNFILSSYSLTAIAIHGIYFKLQSFVFMPIFGLTQGILPILSYNFGSHNYERFKGTLKIALTFTVIVMSIGLLIFQLFPQELLKLFAADEQMTGIGISALRNISMCFIPAAAGIVMGTTFQSIAHPFQSLLMACIRQLLLIIPLAYILGKMIGLSGVWAAYWIAEIINVSIFIPICIRMIKKEFHVETPNENKLG